VKEGLDVKCIPTSIKTEKLAKVFCIPLTDFSSVSRIDLAIDGTDEFDDKLNLIKGGGGSLVREKIVGTFAEKMIIIADASKKVSALGEFPLPVEVVPFGWELTSKLISNLGGNPELRM